jgi:hypothetical protein
VAPEHDGIVLLIEPHYALRRELTEYLSRSDFLVVPAADEASGLVIARRVDVRVVVVAVPALDDAIEARLHAGFGTGGRRARCLFAVVDDAGGRRRARHARRDITVLPRPIDLRALKRLLSHALRPRTGRRGTRPPRSRTRRRNVPES